MESLVLKRYTDSVAMRLASREMTVDDVGVMLEIIREYDRAIRVVMAIGLEVEPDEPWTGEVAEVMHRECCTSRIRVEELALSELGEEYGSMDH